MHTPSFITDGTVASVTIRLSAGPKPEEILYDLIEYMVQNISQFAQSKES